VPRVRSNVAIQSLPWTLKRWHHARVGDSIPVIELPLAIHETILILPSNFTGATANECRRSNADVASASLTGWAKSRYHDVALLAVLPDARRFRGLSCIEVARDERVAKISIAQFADSLRLNSSDVFRVNPSAGDVLCAGRTGPEAGGENDNETQKYEFCHQRNPPSLPYEAESSCAQSHCKGVSLGFPQVPRPRPSKTTDGIPRRIKLAARAPVPLSALLPETILLADRGYGASRIRELARQRGAWANIPPKLNRKDPICFSPYLYRARNLIERFFNKIKRSRRVATRYASSQQTISCSSNSPQSEFGCVLMSPRPSFSVVIPTFNRANFLRQALFSALRQAELDDFEVLVVDDCSEQETWSYLQSWKIHGCRSCATIVV
jgi:transposase